MAVIDPKKLLPESTKTTSILVPKKNVSIASPGTPALKPADPAEKVGSKLVIKKLIKIDEVLQDTLKVKKDREKKEDQVEKKEKREKQEAALEKKKDGKKKADKLFSVPKAGGLDWLSNWLQWTAIGFLFNNFKGLLEYLSPIWNNVIKPLGAILYGVFTGIVKGVVTFIELGYNAYTAIEGLVGDLGGENAKEEFNKASSTLTTVFNTAIIALMIAASTRPGGGKPGSPGTKPGRGGTPTRPGTGGRPQVTTSGGGRAGGSGLRNPFRARPNVSQGGAGTRVTQAVGNRVTGRGAARVTAGAGGKVAGKMGLKAAGRLLKPVLGRLPIVGGLIEFLISWAMGDPIGKAAFRGVGATLFAALGGIIGSVVPVFGTAIGAALGGFAGGEAGGLLYDVMFGGKDAKPKVEKKQSGGQVGSKTTASGGRSISKREKKTQVTKVNKTQTLPGKDFAGKKKIEEFYGKDKGLLGTGFGAKQDTPYDALYQSSQIAKENRALNGVIGSLIGTGIDLTLGQKPSSSTIKQISTTLSTFVQASMQAEMDGTVQNIQQLFALETGGTVPSRTLSRRDASPVSLMKQNIERGISSAIQKTSTEVFDKIRSVMDGKKQKEESNANNPQSPNTGASPNAPSGSNVSVTGGSADFWTLVAIASLESGNAQGRADVAQSIYNRQRAGAANGYPGGPSLKGMITHGVQYQPVGEGNRSLWEAITDKESAIAAVESHKNGKGRGKQMIEAAAAAITDTSLQNNARDFVGARTDFSTPSAMSVHSEYRGTHRADEAIRHGHVFGWFVGPGAVAYGTKVKGKGGAAIPDLKTMRSETPLLGSNGSFADVSGSDPVFPFPGAFHKSSDYGMRNGKMHAGIDIVESQVGGRYRADARTPILAAADGTVVGRQYNSGRDAYLAGCRIDHPSLKMSLRYLHMNPNVRPGDKVKRGQVIGTLVPIAGNGSSTGNTHLHLEFYKIGSPTVLNNSGQIYRQFLSGSTKVTMGQIKSGNLPQPPTPPTPSTTIATKFNKDSVNSFFGAKESFRKNAHEGIDIEAPQGTKISFSVGGTVLASYPTTSTSKDSNGGYGAFIDVRLGNGKVLRMSHLSKIPNWVKSGAKFGPNEVVAFSGGEPGTPGAGRSGGPHIHFEQHSKSGLGIEETLKNKVDPLKYGGFDDIQKGGTLRQNISSLQVTPAYQEQPPVLLYQKELVMVG